MRYFRITTPTALELAEIVTLGLTSKLNSNKIGHKGSGMKYAAAYLHRLGSWMEAKTPTYHVRSETVRTTVRGVDHDVIQLRSIQDGAIFPAHITTHAGADTWGEPYFILRELLQNTIDEGGSYKVTEDPQLPAHSGTVVQVLMTPELEEAWSQKDVWFQPRYAGIINNGHPEVKGLYYHGFLVYRATQNWRYSYDCSSVLKPAEISEDRQVKNCDLRSVFFKICEDANFEALTPEIYDSGLQGEAPEDIQLIFDAIYHHISHSKTEWGGQNGFKLSRLLDAFRKRFGEMAAYHTNTLSTNDPQIYYARAAGFEPALVPYKTGCILGYSDLKQISECLPTIVERVQKVKKVNDLTAREKLRVAMRLVRRIRPADVKVEVVAKRVASDTLNCSALADPANNRVLVMEELLNRDIPDIAKALIEEYVHLKSGAGDNSREMQDALIGTIFELLTRNRSANVENLS